MGKDILFSEKPKIPDITYLSDFVFFKRGNMTKILENLEKPKKRKKILDFFADMGLNN